MWRLNFVIATALFKFSSSQYLPCNQPVIAEFIKFSSPPSPSSPATTNVLCKNLASTIQDAALSQFSVNAAKVPIFGSISDPIVQELCSCMSCPYCSKYNVKQNRYTKSLIPSSDVPKILSSANIVKILNNDQTRRLSGADCSIANNRGLNYASALKPCVNTGLVNVGADLLNSALKMTSSLSNSMICKSNAALKANAPNVNNSYRELVTVVRTLPCNCGCANQLLV